MPVDFLTAEQQSKYGQFSGEPNEAQLARYFHLDEFDMNCISRRRGAQNRLGFALQLTSVRFLGAFPSNLDLAPTNVKDFLARQLSVGDTSVLQAYAKREATRHEHTLLIRRAYEYHNFNNYPWFFRLSRLLYTRAWVTNERPSLMFDFSTAWFIQNKVLLPGASTLTRLISEIRSRSANRLWQKLAALPTTKQKIKLDTLLSVPEGEQASRLDSYRKGPVRISGPALSKPWSAMKI